MSPGRATFRAAAGRSKGETAIITHRVRNVNEALTQGVRLLQHHGIREESRDGPVLRHSEPVCTLYDQPCERVLFQPDRDANPFFHLIEALWMIAGRDTLKDLTPYVGRIAQYSDDGGKTQPAAYGKRWRNHLSWAGEHQAVEWGDQLNWVVKRLRSNPSDRRVVIQMWDPPTDIPAADRNSKDVPCNLEALPWVSPDGRLNLSVFCRSNDMVMGAYGANAVHFSFLLEYLAGRIGLPVGRMWQISNNFHMYQRDALTRDNTWGPGDLERRDPYQSGKVAPLPIFSDWDSSHPRWERGREKHKERLDGTSDTERERILQEDLLIFFEHGAREAATKARWPFLRRVAVPMALAHEHYRSVKGEDRYNGAIEILQQCQATDWQWVAAEWITRRHDKWRIAADTGAQHG